MAKWSRRWWSTFIPVMACCLSPSSHFLIQWRLINIWRPQSVNLSQPNDVIWCHIGFGYQKIRSDKILVIIVSGNGLSPVRHMNQCRLLVNLTLTNKFHRISNQNTTTRFMKMYLEMLSAKCLHAVWVIRNNIKISHHLFNWMFPWVSKTFCGFVILYILVIS